MGPFFAIHNPVGTNISRDMSIMQAGGARYEYQSPLLPNPNPFTDAELISGEEIVLGILSLFIISLISSLVYDILLRAGPNMAYSTRAISIAAALESVERWGFRPRASRMADRRARFWFRGIVVVLFLATSTFSMEVALIAATQETDVSTTGEKIGFTLTTPVVTTWGMGQFLRRTAPTRPCVTPTISGGVIEWKARLQTCLTVNYTDALTRNVPYSGRMRYQSVYHRLGADHFLTALDIDLTYSLSVRTKLYRESVAPVEVPRTPLQNEKDTALLVHLTAPIYYATNRMRNTSRTCSQTQIPPLVYNHSVTKRNVTVAQIESGVLVGEGSFYTTEFDLDVEDIEWWLVQGLGSAAASAGVALTGTPTYLAGRTAEIITVNDVMYVTKQRKLTAPTMAVLLAFLLLFKILVQRFLKPLSLFEIAGIKAMEAARIVHNDGIRQVQGSIPMSMERNIHGLGTCYSRPAEDLTQWYDMTYEDAKKFYVTSTKCSE